MVLALLCLNTSSVFAQSRTTVFSEDFEGARIDSKGWTGQLYRHDRWDVSTRSPHGGSKAARYDCYVSGDRGDMITPSINLAHHQDNKLSFWVRSKNRKWLWANYFNHLYVYLSNDNGNTWTQIDHITKVSNYTYKEYTIDNYLIPTSQVKIKFTGQGGNADDNDHDTFVDDIRVTGIPFTPPAPTTPTKLDLLQHWAPQVYQDTRRDEVGVWPLTYQYHEAQDLIVKADFDGNWYTGDNWENSDLPNNGNYPSMIGHAYSSLVETATHYYLSYGYYHTADDAVIEADRHENDYEDVNICIQKDGSQFGKFRALVTNQHGDRLKYTSGDLHFNGSHPKVYISSNGDVINGCGINAHGHGIESYKPGEHCTGSDGIIYNVADIGQAPSQTGGGAFSHQYNYALVDMNELWNRRTNYDNHPFRSYGNFAAGGGDPQGGNAPWTKQIFNHPAQYFASNFGFLTSEGSFSYNYTHNPYYNNSSSNPTGNPVIGLPAGWASAAVGNPAKSGGAYFTNQTFTVDGGGNDIWGSSDQFRMVYQSMNGDGEIIARVYGIQQNINAWSKAGVMIRESLAANAKFAMYVNTGNNGLSMQYRSNTGGGASHNTKNNPQGPVWLKLVRSGNTFTSYYSTNGSSWVYHGSATVVMDAQVFVGLAVTSHDVNQLCSAWFEKVSVNGNTVDAAMRTANSTLTHTLTDVPKESVKLFANQKTIHIWANENGSLADAELYVYDLMGKMVVQKKLGNEPKAAFHIQAKSGIYIARLITADQQVISKRVWLK